MCGTHMVYLAFSKCSIARESIEIKKKLEMTMEVNGDKVHKYELKILLTI